ncbi:MAG TPA: class II aldolase/adducin family protein, partial [Candidatus Obscuribacter sp.]|nr:class II aldolase/adducin family protein [Candidatus Obscuribacter sp.]
QDHLVKSLGDKHCLILRNHGLLVWEANLPDAFFLLWTLNRACEIQMDVAGTTPKTITCPEANGTSTVKRLGEDGITVDTIDTLSKSNKVVATAKGNGAKVDIPAEWLQNIRPTPLPNFKDEDAPPPVYDFH